MYKALIIDDEKPVRVAITALAEWDKWDIEEPETAVNGKDALEKLHRLNVDIVFVDMNMPIMNGIQFMDRVSVEFPDIKFIVISGYSDFQYAHSAIRHRAVDYLLKPIVADDLNEALRKAVSSLNSKNHIFTANNVDYLSSGGTVDSLKKCIDSHYTENISLSKLSEEFSLSKEYLCKLFKKKYGLGIYQYIQLVRMQKATELLLENTLKIQDISESLGFSDNNYFSKAFKRFFDMSPSKYREEYGYKEI